MGKANIPTRKFQREQLSRNFTNMQQKIKTILLVTDPPKMTKEYIH